MQADAPVVNDRDPPRVHWMELFFDLIFVALVAQLAHGLHSDPTIPSLGVFAALFATVWWSWVNLTFAVNVSAWLTQRQLSLLMLAAMFAVGVVAVAASEATTDRAWLFAAGNAAIRLVLLGIWLRNTSARRGWARIRVLAYNGATAALWFVSIWLPAPGNYVLWAPVILAEVLLLVGSTRAWADRLMPRFNIGHLAERFGLLVVIVLGESVLTAVSTLSDSWSLDSGLAAALGLVIVALLAWGFFLYGVPALEHGLEGLALRGRFSAIRDIIGFLPYFLVLGVPAISGAIAVAIHEPHHPLPDASVVALYGGITLFYVVNAVVSVRLGRPPAPVLSWALPALLLTVVAAVLTVHAESTVVLAAATAVLVVTVIAETNYRRRARGVAPAGLSS